jgi:hypothetical protein
MKKEAIKLTPLEIEFLNRARKETPTMKVGVSIPKSLNKGWTDTPLFNQEQKQTKLF